ncbi:MAG: hypothetical protein M0Z77_06320 [Thermoplasmatales archaeon]|nr:hypothetical protein [Thermoplasmatales archaeon]
MSTEEWVLEKNGYVKNQGKSKNFSREESKLLVSLHSIEFTKNPEGYFQVASDIYFSNLLYLLYVKKVSAGNDFETAKERAKSVLVNQLEKKKYDILSKATIENENTLDSIKTGRKLMLLNRAISVLENEKSDGVYCNFNIPESP